MVLQPEVNPNKLFIRLNSHPESFLSSNYIVHTKCAIQEEIEQTQELILPNINGINIVFKISIGTTRITEGSTPDIVEFLRDEVSNGEMWKQLGYQAEIQQPPKNNDESSFCLKLIDKTMNPEMFSDVIDGTDAIFVLNKTKIKIMKSIEIQLLINDFSMVDANDNNYEIKLNIFSKHLNYLMASNFIQWGDKYPLVFSYYSRLAHKTSVPFFKYLFDGNRPEKAESRRRRKLSVGFLKQSTNLQLHLQCHKLNEARKVVRIKNNILESKPPLEIFRFSFFKKNT